jgi:hypothetical protein
MIENHKRGARFARIGCVVLALTTASAGCASIVNGTKQKVSFSSDPPGASVIVDGTEMGTTPTEVELARDRKHSVRIEKAGYVAYESSTSTTFHDAWMFADLPVALFVPPVMFLEYLDPGAYDLSPKEVKARLIEGPSESTH